MHTRQAALFKTISTKEKEGRRITHTVHVLLQLLAVVSFLVYVDKIDALSVLILKVMDRGTHRLAGLRIERKEQDNLGASGSLDQCWITRNVIAQFNSMKRGRHRWRRMSTATAQEQRSQ